MTNFPLTWPPGWRRTKEGARKKSAFKIEKQRLSVADGVRRVLEELRLFGFEPEHVLISTNVQPTLAGMPRTGQPEPVDPGVAVYWKGPKDSTHKVMATDVFMKVADNLAALAGTLGAMRKIERYGGAIIMERVFTGFLALPAPNTWRAVMGYGEDDQPALKAVQVRYRTLAKEKHPDQGGSEAAMSELNWAMQQAERELTPFGHEIKRELNS